jgi:predicted RNase H-like HicB family nuclease
MQKRERKVRFGGYSIRLFLDEDNDWVAYLMELPSISAFGDSPKKALRELGVAWAAAKESSRA